MGGLHRIINDFLNRPRVPTATPRLGRYLHRIENVGNLPITKSLRSELYHFFDIVPFPLVDDDLTLAPRLAIPEL